MNLLERARVSLTQSIATPLIGVQTSGWLRLLAENRLAIAPSCWPRAAVISLFAAGNSVTAWMENLRLRRAVEQTTIQPPIFILGHWRSGTTHLHNLITRDERFAFPNFYQVTFPNGFLLTERTQKPLWGKLLPKTRMFDSMENDFSSPAEDEFALYNASGLSPYMSWTFPRRWRHYERFLTLRDLTPTERRRWQETLVGFFRKLSFKYGKPLVLKSPTHTCRVRTLLELFPDARFVHIHRDPLDVYVSTRRMLSVFTKTARLQRLDEAELDEHIFRAYRVMHDAYFEERGLLASDRLIEIGFADLETNPLATIERIYQTLKLPDLDQFRPALVAYLDSIKDYKKNPPREIEPALRARIVSDWQRCFDEWGYQR